MFSGGDHFGQDEQTQKVLALVEKKQQLEAALPMVDDNKAMLIEARLDKIEIQLEREIARAQAVGNAAAIEAAMGLNGMGGLSFQAEAPAGVGRLVRLPFYPDQGATGYITGSGTAALTTTIPTIGATIPSNYGTSLASFVMKTPAISWALLRIVGFEIEIHNAQTTAPSKDLNLVLTNPAAQGAVAYTLTTGLNVNAANAVSLPKVVVKNLKVGGGATLFTHEEFADGGIYDSALPEFCGLRDYPLLKSPNVAEVEICALGCGGSLGEGSITAGGGTAVTGISNGAQSIIFSANLICEVLKDDQYGAHTPGPYARSQAMVRRGGSFVS